MLPPTAVCARNLATRHSTQVCCSPNLPTAERGYLNYTDRFLHRDRGGLLEDVQDLLDLLHLLVGGHLLRCLGAHLQKHAPSEHRSIQGHGRNPTTAKRCHKIPRSDKNQAPPKHRSTPPQQHNFTAPFDPTTRENRQHIASSRNAHRQPISLSTIEKETPTKTKALTRGSNVTPRRAHPELGGL